VLRPRFTLLLIVIHPQLLTLLPGGWDRTTEKIEAEIAKQIQQAFDNVEHTIKEAGGRGWEDVFFLRSYHVIMDDEAVHAMIDCLKKYCPNHQPTWTALGVPKLAFEEMKVEIEVRAHVPAESK
jgi:enamine deaminase RidA (YjgF/YER057c/UK114 family)